DEKPLPFEEGRCLDFFNGDLKGIEDAIPHLKNLGVTVVYVNPIGASKTTHRYDCCDFFHIDEKLVERCRELIEAAKREQKPALVLNAALLYRMKLHVLCDRVVFVQAPFLVRFMRAKKREHSTFKRFVAREKAQKDISKKIFPSSLEVSVMHNGTAQVRIHRQVTTYCATIGIGVSSV
ncbi:MAG: alpha-amylase family glycosyl hydrolase, partial [Sphaerochaeta sp.]|nr:alpha-amylase family glycosyl hydrolase [Sphaerochaeta sp.]